MPERPYVCSRCGYGHDLFTGYDNRLYCKETDLCLTRRADALAQRAYGRGVADERKRWVLALGEEQLHYSVTQRGWQALKNLLDRMVPGKGSQG